MVYCSTWLYSLRETDSTVNLSIIVAWDIEISSLYTPRFIVAGAAMLLTKSSFRCASVRYFDHALDLLWPCRRFDLP